MRLDCPLCAISGHYTLGLKYNQRGKGQMMVTVHREGRKTEVPLGGSRQKLEQRVVQRACDELGLDPSQLPGPQSRV